LDPRAYRLGIGEDRPDVLVIGAGAVGLCCAHTLDRAGASVAIVDAAIGGSGASRGNIGWMTPTLAAPLTFPGVRETLRALTSRQGPLVIGSDVTPGLLRWLWRFHRRSSPERFRTGLRALASLAEASHAELDRCRDEGVNYEAHETGLLTVAASPKGLDWLLRLVEQLEGVGYRGRLVRLDGDEARAREPALGRLVAAAAHTSIDRHVRPESLCSGLLNHLRSWGVCVGTGIAVRGVRVRPDGPVAETSAGAVPARAVIVATGAGANELLAAAAGRSARSISRNSRSA
jgi:D-amino-acid dehydrogenase